MNNGPIWTVELNSNHAPYNLCKFKRSLPGNENYTVVIVDTLLFMDCYQREKPSYIIAPVDQWSTEKTMGIRAFLNPQSGIPEMPRVSFSIVEKARFWGLCAPKQLGVVSFINGRHRSRYLQYAGATHFPVEVHNDMASTLFHFCGQKY